MEQSSKNAMHKKNHKTTKKQSKRDKTTGKSTHKKKKAQISNTFTQKKKKKDLLVVQNITTSRLIIRNNVLSNVIRSSFVEKDPVLNLKEESKALMDEDFFKIIDISNNKNFHEKNKKKTTENLLPQQIETKVIPINEITENRSIFREIDTKYEEIISKTTQESHYLISPNDLQVLVRQKYAEQKNVAPNSWQRTLKSFLSNVGAPNYFKEIISRIVNNQSEINQNCALWELKNKYEGRKVAESCLKHKFVRRYNELTKLQNLGGNMINTSEAGDLIRKAGLFNNPADNKCLTPLKSPLDLGYFSSSKNKTPENQKFFITEIPSTSGQLTPAIKSNFNDKYLRLSSKRCLNDDFVKQHGINKQQQSFFLKQAIEDEKNKQTAFESVLNRPKKPHMLQQNRIHFQFEFTSPKCVPFEENSPKLRPNRKLNFSQKFSDENFDFSPLDEPTPDFQFKITPNTYHKSQKRSLGTIYTPPEIYAFKRSLESKEDLLKNVKQFAMHSNDLGPIPVARATPQFKFQPFLK